MDRSEIIERVMRMGIEHRSGIPLEELDDLAEKQLRSEQKQRAQSNGSLSIDDWWNDSSIPKYAFVSTNDKLELRLFSSPTPEYSFVGWRLDTFPEFRFDGRKNVV